MNLFPAPLVPEPEQTRSLSQAAPRRTPQFNGGKGMPVPAAPLDSGWGQPGRGRGERGGVGAKPPQYLDTHRNISNALKRLQKLYIAHDLQAALEGCDRGDEAGRIGQCGLYFRGYVSDCGSERLRPLVCGHVLCPRCQRERSKPLQRRVYSVIRSRPERTYRFLTLTVRNVAAIDRAYVDRVIDCFRQLRARPVWKNVTGGFYSIDTTYNAAAETWHVHLHTIVEYQSLRRGWLPPEWLAEVKREWHAITGDSYVVHIRTVNPRAVKELVKYAAKLVTFLARPELVDEYLKAFFNVRRVQGFGSFLGVEIEPPHSWRCKCGKCRWENWHAFGIFSAQDLQFVDGEPRLKSYATGPPVECGPPLGPFEFPLSNPNYQEAMV